jgi:SPP1 gp7 family putative phage head morphogenesis protein
MPASGPQRGVGVRLDPLPELRLQLLAEVEPRATAAAVLAGDRQDAADGGLARLFDPTALARRLLALLRLRAAGVERITRATFRRQLEATLRVRPNLRDDAVATVMHRAWPSPEPRPVTRARDRWLASNVDLVARLGTELRRELEEVLADALQKGSRHELVARRIAERLHVARSRAKVIARDQLQKYQAQVNEAQQRRAGIDRYVWRHSGSGRNPRPEHLARDGRVFSWSDPPADGHPGAAIQCRCTAEPSLD